MATTEVTKQFEKSKCSVPEGTKYFIGATAGRKINGVDVFMVAPTVELLSKAWNEFHYRPLDVDRVQLVAIIDADLIVDENSETNPNET